MKHVSLFILLGVLSVCVGCTSKSTSSGSAPSANNLDKKIENKNTDGANPNPKTAKKSNPLVGKWTVTKSNTHWAENVSKQAIVEFLADGETPNSGTMTITNNNNIKAEADYMWQGEGFVFQAKFIRPDGNKNGYGAQVEVKKMTDNEIIADVFTLKRIK